MASETRTETGVETETGTLGPWAAGATAGFVAGAVMGLMLTMQMTPVIERAIPALWGLDGMLAGWIVHLVNSVVFGLVFAALVTRTPVRRYVDSIGEYVAAGLAWGVVLWIVAAGIVMPIWLSAVGFPMAPPLPNFNPMSLVGHLVYGLVLGGAYPLLTR